MESINVAEDCNKNDEKMKARTCGIDSINKRYCQMEWSYSVIDPSEKYSLETMFEHLA